MTIQELKEKLEKTFQVLASELRSLRLSRANSELVEHIMVEAYEGTMPLLQVASVQTPQSNQLLIQAWDAALVPAIEEALRQSELQVNPVVEGELIRITLPPLTQERRRELLKVVARHAEEGRIAVRNVREEAMDALDQAEKAKEISEDEKFRRRDEVQKAVQEYNERIKELVEKKEREVLS
jgi:ribosome recycling factor